MIRLLDQMLFTSLAKKPILLDLCCGSGGTTKGYQRAGFYVVGVDIKFQPRYCGDEFYQADLFDFVRNTDLERFTAIHVSPPCQGYSITWGLHKRDYPKLVESVRAALIQTGKPYIIENVPGAPLINPVMLCGTMFGLKVIRHRLFECSPSITFAPATCRHEGYATGNRAERVKGSTRTPTLSDGFSYVTVAGNNYIKAEGAEAMGIDWMTRAELSQAIPPAYTEWLGRQILLLHKEKLYETDYRDHPTGLVS